jgi:ABC-2 type transport system ATP-binding protein
MGLAIQANGLTRDFGALRAVDQLSLGVPEGGIFGFLGPNGAGKTTTILLLLGLLELTAGHALVLGCDPRTQGDRIRERTGALLEHPGLYEQLSAFDNLAFYARIHRLSTTDAQRRIADLLSEMGLWDRRSERIAKWSKGMQQKLAIARALLHRPSLVFLDEPTAGLDVVAAAAVRDTLASLALNQGMTVFLTTHNMAEAERLCSRIAVIRDGRLLAVGTSEEIKRTDTPRATIHGRGFTPGAIEAVRAIAGVRSARLENAQLLLTLDPSTDTAPILNRLIASGVQVEELIRDKASLEEAFLRLVEEDE